MVKGFFFFYFNFDSSLFNSFQAIIFLVRSYPKQIGGALGLGLMAVRPCRRIFLIYKFFYCFVISCISFGLNFDLKIRNLAVVVLASSSLSTSFVSLGVVLRKNPTKIRVRMQQVGQHGFLFCEI